MKQKIIGYIRISTDKQDLDKQRHLLLEYAQKERLVIDEFIEVEVSSRQDVEVRRIDELQSKLQQGDILLVAELSRRKGDAPGAQYHQRPECERRENHLCSTA